MINLRDTKIIKTDPQSIIFSDTIIENRQRSIAKYCIFIKICAQDLQPLEELTRE